MSKHVLADYLLACRERRSTGAVTPETSLYSQLETLLNEVGRTPGHREQITPI